MRVDVCLLKSIQNNKHLAYNARCGAEIKSPFKDDNSYVPCIYFFIINRQTLPLFSLLSSPVLGFFFLRVYPEIFSSLSSFHFLHLLPFNMARSTSYFIAPLFTPPFILSFAHNGKNLLSDS